MENQVAVNDRRPILNDVPGFDPLDYARVLLDEDGKKSLYLEVKDRILWFRLHRPDGRIIPEVIHVTENSAVVRCRVYANKSDPDDQFIGQAFAQRFRGGEDKFGDRFLEMAETAATGRALAAAGYGTQFCGSFDMLSSIISDTPVELPEEAVGDGAVVTSCAVHQFCQTAASAEPAAAPAPTIPVPQKAQQSQPQPVPQRQSRALQASAQPAQQAAGQAQDLLSNKAQTVEELIAVMTLEDAKNVVVDFGKYAGSTLGQIAMIRPADLDWYVKHYSGKNTAIKAGASILLHAAQQQAG